MTKPYTHLTKGERYQIHSYKKAGLSPAAITPDLNRHVLQRFINSSIQARSAGG